MRRWLAPTTLTLALAAAAVAADAPNPAPAAGPVLKSAGDIDFHASGSLPPGAEYHLMFEDKATGGVQTIVRMPRGYSLPPHSHTADETIYVVKGKLSLGFSGKTTTLSAGGYAVIPAGVEFTMTAEGFGGAQFLALFDKPYDVKPAAGAPAR